MPLFEFRCPDCAEGMNDRRARAAPEPDWNG
jgi:hypothetical protein